MMKDPGAFEGISHAARRAPAPMHAQLAED
jgi:hypothetical protein